MDDLDKTLREYLLEMTMAGGCAMHIRFQDSSGDEIGVEIRLLSQEEIYDIPAAPPPMVH